MKKLEEKKGTVANKLTTSISKLEKKRKEHMDMAKSDPKTAAEHKKHVSEISSKIEELMDKLSMVEKSKKPIEEKEDGDKQADLAENIAINERVDMDTLSDELKQLIKKYPGEKITYSFITNKDYPKGYVFYKNGKIIKETIQENEGGDLQAFQKMLDSHDWYYMMSDSPRTYDNGIRQASDIKKMMNSLGEPGKQAYKAALIKRFPNAKVDEKKTLKENEGNLQTKYEVYEHEDESDDRGSSYYYTIKEKVSESINETLIGINPELVKKVKNFVNGIAKLYGYGTSDAIYNINAVIEFIKKQSIDETQDKSYKVDDIVVVNKGPHKGIKHKIIHVSGDGKYNIKPILPPGSKNQYRLGASSATANDFEN
jgi:hypothetical protein